MINDIAIHEFFGLSYTSWLVLPRVVLQQMPDAWQRKFTALLQELPNWSPPDLNFHVQARDRHSGQIVTLPEDLINYRHPQKKF